MELEWNFEMVNLGLWKTGDVGIVWTLRRHCNAHFMKMSRWLSLSHHRGSWSLFRSSPFKLEWSAMKY
jgi:hypothetical protein